MTSFRCYRNGSRSNARPHLSDHQKLAQARAEIARLRKVAGVKAEPLTDATRRKLEGELIKVKLENDRLREQLAAKSAPASSALLRQQVKELQAEIAAKPKPAKSAPQPRVFLTFSPSIEGHPISGTLMDRYGSGKAKTRKKARKKARKKRPRRHARRREADVSASSAPPPRPRSSPTCRERPKRSRIPWGGAGGGGGEEGEP